MSNKYRVVYCTEDHVTKIAPDHDRIGPAIDAAKAVSASGGVAFVVRIGVETFQVDFLKSYRDGELDFDTTEDFGDVPPM